MLYQNYTHYQSNDHYDTDSNPTVIICSWMFNHFQLLHLHCCW